MIIYKSILFVLCLIFGVLAMIGIIKAILNYKKEIRKIEKEYNIKIICK